MTYTEVTAVKVLSPKDPITHNKPREVVVENSDGTPVLMVNENGTWHHYINCAFVIIQDVGKGPGSG